MSDVRDDLLAGVEKWKAEAERLTTALRAATASESRLRGALEAFVKHWDEATTENNSRDVARAVGHSHYSALFDALAAARAALLPEGTPDPATTRTTP